MWRQDVDSGKILITSNWASGCVPITETSRHYRDYADWSWKASNGVFVINRSFVVLSRTKWGSTLWIAMRKNIYITKAYIYNLFWTSFFLGVPVRAAFYTSHWSAHSLALAWQKQTNHLLVPYKSSSSVQTSHVIFHNLNLTHTHAHTGCCQRGLQYKITAMTVHTVPSYASAALSLDIYSTLCCPSW